MFLGEKGISRNTKAYLYFVHIHIKSNEDLLHSNPRRYFSYILSTSKSHMQIIYKRQWKWFRNLK